MGTRVRPPPNRGRRNVLLQDNAAGRIFVLDTPAIELTSSASAAGPHSAPPTHWKEPFMSVM